jgi:vacuolar protein sorting-associated protein 35
MVCCVLIFPPPDCARLQAEINEDDQDKYLEEATQTVKQQAFYMKRAIDQSDLKQALKCSSEMLRELRTSLMTPKNYYELFMKVFDELRWLENYFAEVHRNGKPMVELYEMVQSCGNVLPRLYLLITVGSVYIQSREAPAKDILKDLVEMAKGVQHPMRGLFLRNYLSHISKDKLPDLGSEYEGHGGSVNDAIEFVLQNFAETNKLWVRMQHQSATRDKKKREAERQELRILVGTNLVRLSQLEGVDLNMYQTIVLPRVLEQVANCKDKIAQFYLMDCIIQVFPDEFHINTLEPFLTTCTQLVAQVDVKLILCNLMNRLASYADGQADVIPAELNAFKIFNDFSTKIITEQASVEASDVLSVHTALLTFALQCYPGHLDYVDHCLSYCAKLLGEVVTENLDASSIRQVEKLLTVPLESLSLQVLNLEHYPELMQFLHWESRKAVAKKLLKVVLDTNTPLDDVDMVGKLFAFIRPLVKDDSDTPTDDDFDEEEFQEEQLLVARLVSLMHHDDTDILFKIYGVARKHFGQGGVKRIEFTLVPLVFAALRLAQNVSKRAQEGVELAVPPRKILQFVHEIVTALAPNCPDMSLKLFLQCAMAADACDFEAIAYEFVTQAFILYEDEMADSKAQQQALSVMVGTLLQCRRFEQGNYDTLITKTTQYAAKLLKKPDQCKMVTICSHLFWAGAEDDERKYHDGRRVLECLQRSLKIADVCMTSSQHVNLFVEILDQYLFYFEQNNPAITAKYISGLIALINEHMENMEASEQRDAVQQQYKNTLAHIQMRKDGEATAEKFADIAL